MRLIFNKNRMGIYQIMAHVRKFVVLTGKFRQADEMCHILAQLCYNFATIYNRKTIQYHG